MTLIGLTLYGAPKVGAFSFPNLLGPVKDFFTPDSPKNLTLDSKIELTPNGDANKNNQIDGGDIVRFTYVLTNPTKEKYLFATLNTNIDRKALNFIHNVSGVTGLDDSQNTIKLPNLRLESDRELVIGFDARINYSIEDKLISTEPELLTEDKKSVLKAIKKEVKALKVKPEDFPGQVKVSAKKQE
jgi:hypothetical protein